MNDLIAATVSGPIVPVAQTPIAIRTATLADLPFLDALQKQHSKALGYFPTKQFEGYIEMGGVLVAWASRPCADGSMGETPMPLGYVISRDRYLKRDELGVIYQLCVAPGHQRGLIGASLIKAVFERSAYGCRLYCCWCAQDLDANYFWESLGFVPIAFRAGSTGKKRVHIFWQRRIVDGDATPYWYPFQTNAGAIREDRIVLPIPPGTHWKEVRPVALPTAGGGQKALTDDGPRGKKARRPVVAPVVQTVIAAGGLRFAPAPDPSAQKKARAPKAKPPAERIDPKYLTAARELRDRYLERLNESPNGLPAPAARYDVSRSLAAPDVARALPNAA